MDMQTLAASTNNKKLKMQMVAGLCSVPAALSLGVALSSPAAAQTAISASQTSTVNLGSYAGINNFSISSGTSLTASGGNGVYGDASGSWNLSNAGHVAASSGVGVLLNGVGEVGNTGSISGNQAGVALNAGGSIGNQGEISGTRYGVVANNSAASVNNDGAITAHYDGISLNHGGSVVNNASGTIFGSHIGIYTGKTLGFVENFGHVSSTTGDAVSLYNGGTFSNAATGVLHGGYTGVYAGGSHAVVQNAGMIQGNSFGVYMDGASALTNSGTIIGGDIGVLEVAAGGSVTNTGLISSDETGVELYRASELDNAGSIKGGETAVLLPHGGLVDNEAGAEITGGSVGIAGSAITLISAGTISAPTAIALSGNSPSYLTFTTGSSVQGSVDGGGTNSFVALTGSGKLTADFQNFGAGSSLTIADGANWAASGSWGIGNVTNNGTLEPGIPGTPLNLTGNFAQGSTGTLLVLVTPTQSTQFNVLGNVNLAGTVNYDFAPGTYTPHAVNFLTASGTTTGAFTAVVYTGVLAAPVVTQTTTQQTAQPTTTAQTSQPATQQISQPVAMRIVPQQVAQLVVAQSFTVTPTDDSLFGSTAQALAASGVTQDDMLMHHADSTGGWAEAMNSRLDAGDMASTTGMLTGIGGRIGTLHLGVAVGYDQTGLNDGQGGKTATSTTRAGVYAAQQLGGLVATAVLSDGFASTTSHRNTGAGIATGRYGSNILSGAVQLAAPMALDGLTLTPAAGLRVTRLSTQGFAETARQAAFALSDRGSNSTSVQPYATLQVSKHFVAARQIMITPSASLSYAQALTGTKFGQSLTGADGTGFSAGAVKQIAGTAGLAAGLTVTRGNVSLQLAYSDISSGRTSTQSANATLAIRF
jgi:uncharacterized protein with beta-barrel porin domain